MTSQTARAASSRTVLLVVMCVGYFLVLLDVTIVNVALPSIGKALNADVSGLQWVVDGYALALAALLLVGGTAGDVLGHRPVVMAGLGLFGAGSMVCAAAPTVQVLVASRFVQGIGAALMLPGTLAVITQAFPERGRQARAIGIWASIGSIALPAGPLAGGLLVDGAGWRWVFWLNVPIVLGVGLVALRITPSDDPEPGRRVDWLGAALAAIALGALAAAVIAVGRGDHGLAPWSAGVVVPVALVAFVIVEHRQPDPMLPLVLLRSRVFCAANAVAFAMNLGTVGLLFVLTLYLQSVRSNSALHAGLMALPLFLPLVVLAPLVGRATSRVGARPPMLVGLALMTAGVGWLATWTAQTSYAGLLPGLVLWGVGLAALTPAVVAAAVGAVSRDRAGLAAGVNNASRQAGGLIGVAAGGAITGSPSRVPAFMAGLHQAGWSAAVLFVLAALTTTVFVGRAPDDS
jgi:MFS transporter, DHA2 family, methylenomycin A resistance protein